MNLRRTKNNDIVLNDKGFSVLNMLLIATALLVIFFFLPLVQQSKSVYGYSLGSFSMFRLSHFDTYALGGAAGPFEKIKAYLSLFLIYPLASIACILLSKKASEKVSYILIHSAYLLHTVMGVIYLFNLFMLNGFIGMAGDMVRDYVSVSFFATILILILFVSVILSVFGVLLTGTMEVDETATAQELNAEYAKEIFKKAGSVASAVAENVSSTVAENAAAMKAKQNQSLTCNHCGNVCSSDSTFCKVCGTPLKQEKEQVKCGKCGNLCSPEDAFCMMCGNDLRENKAEIPQEEAATTEKETAVAREAKETVAMEAQEAIANEAQENLVSEKAATVVTEAEENQTSTEKSEDIGS
jgi:hypothetical protein